MKNTNKKIPKYEVGDTVKIRSKEEISATLDSLGRLNGCLMTDQMWGYCGKTFKIIKVVKNFYDEFKYKMYKTRAPLYLLEGLICNGEVKSFDKRCDRSCYLFWHEDWLEKL